MEGFESVHNLGHVHLEAVEGSDYTVLEAARVSTGAAARKGDAADEKLIRYLMRNFHHSPFEMISFRFNIKLPIFVMRQWVRHRIASYNEASGRYKELPTEFFYPTEWRRQSESNKQGSSPDPFSAHEQLDFFVELDEFYDHAERLYQDFLSKGVARELARIVLPVATYTEFYWKVNFRSLMNFLFLRNDSHAQKEIRDYADLIDKVLSEVPDIKWCYRAFKELYPMTFKAEAN